MNEMLDAIMIIPATETPTAMPIVAPEVSELLVATGIVVAVWVLGEVAEGLVVVAAEIVDVCVGGPDVSNRSRKLYGI
jgi:hypothetical protein